MIALAGALLRSFAADKPGLALAFVAPIAFFSLFALFFGHLESRDGVRFPIAIVVESKSDGAERLAEALLARGAGRVSVERVEPPPSAGAGVPGFVGEIRIPPDFDPGAPSVIIDSRWPLPGVADALKQMVAAAGASAATGREVAPDVRVIDRSSSGTLTRAAVPGIAIMFILFALSAHAGRGVGDDESGLGERLRSLGVSARGRMLARFVTLGVIAFIQLIAIFVFAALAFGIVPESPLALVAAALLAALACAAFTSALCELCGTRARFASVSPIATLILAGLGGSMVPVAVLPEFLAAPSRWLFSGWSVEACLRAIEGTLAATELGLLAASSLLMLLVAAVFAQRNESR